MSFCHQCGHEIPENACFCEWCGELILPQNKGNSTADNVEDSTVNNETQSQYSNNNQAYGNGVNQSYAPPVMPRCSPMNYYIDPNTLPQQYRPVKISEYVLYLIGAGIPILGLVLLIVTVCDSDGKISLKNYAKSLLIVKAVSYALIIILYALFFFFILMGSSYYYY